MLLTSLVCASKFLDFSYIFVASNLPKCSPKDEACQTKAGQEFVNKYHSGLSEINLLPFDPLHIKKMILKKNPSSPVNIEIEFNDLNLLGLKSMKITHIRFVSKESFPFFCLEY